MLGRCFTGPLGWLLWSYDNNFFWEKSLKKVKNKNFLSMQNLILWGWRTTLTRFFFILGPFIPYFFHFSIIAREQPYCARFFWPTTKFFEKVGKIEISFCAQSWFCPPKSKKKIDFDPPPFFLWFLTISGACRANFRNQSRTIFWAILDRCGLFSGHMGSFWGSFRSRLDRFWGLLLLLYDNI